MPISVVDVTTPDEVSPEMVDSICEAGVSVVQEFMKVLTTHNLGLEHAVAVIAIAAAGITKGSAISPEDFMTTIQNILPMWSISSQDGKRGIVFDFEKRPALQQHRSTKNVDRSKSVLGN